MLVGAGRVLAEIEDEAEPERFRAGLRRDADRIADLQVQALDQLAR
jgi:hypothetical protein